MNISDETIRSWKSLSFFGHEQSEVVQQLGILMKKVPQKEPSSEERIRAIQACNYQNITIMYVSRPFLIK